MPFNLSTKKEDTKMKLSKLVLAAGICLLSMQLMGMADKKFCCPADEEKEAEKIKTITTDELKALLDSSTPPIILDARSGKWDDGRRIPGAKSLDASASEEKIAELLPDKNATIVTYCGGVKCPASSQLSERLKKLGYSNVIEYPEGIAGWVEKGNKIENK